MLLAFWLVQQLPCQARQLVHVGVVRHDFNYFDYLIYKVVERFTV